MNAIQYVCSKIKEDDLLHKGFLKPIEIHLKTYQTEKNSHSNYLTSTSLPAGLKIAVKNSINDNKYELQSIVQMTETHTLDELRTSCQDNLLTLMKDYNGIELAICVCMCNEQKRMLKSTLAGIEENISNIVVRQKISSDKIGVFVIMDGIEKVDESGVEYFEEMEKYSGINLGQNIAPTLTLQEMTIRAHNKSQQEINEEQLRNVNNFLFDPFELNDRNERRFSNVKNQYDGILKLRAQIQKLKEKEKMNKKINFDDLPSKLRQLFIGRAQWLENTDKQMSKAVILAHAREEQSQERNYPQEKTKVGKMEEEVKNKIYPKNNKQEQLPEEYLVLKYTEDYQKAKSMILKTLSDGENYCNDYINTRQNLAYLACFRKKIRHGIDKLPPPNKDSNNGSSAYHQNLNEQNTEISHYTTMNLFLCVKYKNGGKLSSHNWFFNGFCKELKPKYAVLLDVGLKPEGKALYKMYRHLKNNNKVGGVCGYMSLKIEQIDDKDEIKDEDIDFFTRFWLNFVEIQRTQQVEYHFAHLLDKPFQAAFGFIHVLPGAFSAYNMKAILNYGEEEDELLKSYFKSINGSNKNEKIIQTNLTIKNILLRTLLPNFVNSCCVDVHPQSDEQMLYNENIYLAEDRILCMGIHKKDKDIVYLPDAYAFVDPMKTVNGLCGQRKRWNNGSQFAFQKVKKEMAVLWQNYQMQIFLRFQMLYLTLMNSLSYFAPSFFLFTVHIAMQAFRVDVLPNLFGGVIPDPNNNQLYKGFVYTIDFIYVILIMSVILFSLLMKSDKKEFKSYLYLITTLFGIFAIIVFIVLLVDVVRGLINSSAYLIENKEVAGDIPGGMQTINVMRWMLVGTTGVYVLPILVYIILFKRLTILCQIIRGAFSFLFYGPTYLIVLNIYSLCRIDDISWGTKGLNSEKSDENKQLKDSWRVIKFIHVSKYVIWNLILSVILLSFGSSYTPRFFITIIVVIIMAFFQSIKVIIAILYLIWYKLKKCQFCCKQPQAFDLFQSSSINEKFMLYKELMMQEITSRLQDVNKEFEENSKKKANVATLFQISRSYRQIKKSKDKNQKIKQNQSKVIKKTSKEQSNFNTKPKSQPKRSINIPKSRSQEQGSLSRIFTLQNEEKYNNNDRNYYSCIYAEHQEDQITDPFDINNYPQDRL